MSVAATTLAFVRTADGGVVQVDEGESLPDVALDVEHVERLTAAGVLAEPVADSGESTSGAGGSPTPPVPGAATLSVVEPAVAGRGDRADATGRGRSRRDS